MAATATETFAVRRPWSLVKTETRRFRTGRSTLLALHIDQYGVSALVMNNSTILSMHHGDRRFDLRFGNDGKVDSDGMVSLYVSSTSGPVYVPQTVVPKIREWMAQFGVEVTQ